MISPTGRPHCDFCGKDLAVRGEAVAADEDGNYSVICRKCALKAVETLCYQDGGMRISTLSTHCRKEFSGGQRF